MAVSHGQEGRLHTFDIEEWMMEGNLVRADDMRFITGEFGDAEDLLDQFTSSSLQARRNPPVVCQPTACPVFASSDA